MALVSCKCPNCNAIQSVDSQKDAAICEQCGAPFVVKQAIVQQEQQFNPEITEKRKLPQLPVVVVICCAIIAVIIGVIAMNNRSVQEISFPSTKMSMTAGAVRELSVDITPENAKNKTIMWSSSDPNVATVSESGFVKAKNPGVCYIEAKSDNGKRATCHIFVEEPEPGLEDVYEELKQTIFCTYASDGSYLILDTNPGDTKGGGDSLGFECIKKANEILKLPESLLAKMAQTRAIDGRQVETYNGFTVSWSYHPDSGLEVMYEKN